MHKSEEDGTGKNSFVIWHTVEEYDCSREFYHNIRIIIVIGL